MLNEDFKITKFRYEKDNQILYIELSVKRYIFFKEEKIIISKIRDMYKLGNSFSDIILEINQALVESDNINEYLNDIY